MKSINFFLGPAAPQYRMAHPHKFIDHGPAQAARYAGNKDNSPSHMRVLSVHLPRNGRLAQFQL
jgi:hypothetical protein